MQGFERWQTVVWSCVCIAPCKHGEGHGSPALLHVRASAQGHAQSVSFAYDAYTKAPGIATADDAPLLRQPLVHREIVLAALGARGPARR